MKTFVILALAALSAAITSLASASTPEMASPSATASFVVDTNAPTKPYNRMIFGGFVEHFDSQVYGGIFEPGSPLADAKGFRLDTIAALKELKVPIIRWPGGCFVDSYHWQKGVGKDRQPYGDSRWGVIEPNTFGTHEFVEFCRRIGAEPYICHNGLAEPQENLDWVAYCNATEGRFAEMRAANGHPAPLNVRFWSVGNERYDKDYVDRVRETVKQMKALDPNLQITCAGSQGGGEKNIAGISSYLMEQAGRYLDYVSVHNYYLPRADELPNFDYLTAIMRSESPDANLTIVTDSLRSAGLDRIKVAFDEWNLRAWQHPGFPRDLVENFDAPDVRKLVALRRQQNDVASQYTLADALFAASFLNACLRHSEQVTMATVAPLVNTRGPLFVHPKGVVRRTHFHTMAMYANLLEARVAVGQVRGDQLKHGTETVAVVDALATTDEAGRQWRIALVNRHPSEAVACTVKLGDLPLDGTFNATQLAGDSPNAYNDIEHPDRVAPRKVKLTFRQGVANLPPHSLTIVEIKRTLPKPIPAKVVVLTFDDTCVSQATFVGPLLKKLGFGGTFYVTEAFTDKQMYMSWQQIKSLEDMGFEIGNHSVRHPNFHDLKPEECLREIVGIEDNCAANGVARPTTFCWPGYGVNNGIFTALAEKGYLFARGGGERPYAPATDNRFDTPSFTIHEGTLKNKDSFVNAAKQAVPGKIVIFTFHGVPDPEHPWVTTDPANFEQCMNYLKEKGYTVLAMRDMATYIDPAQ